MGGYRGFPRSGRKAYPRICGFPKIRGYLLFKGGYRRDEGFYRCIEGYRGVTVSQIRGYRFGATKNKDYSIVAVYFGVPLFMETVIWGKGFGFQGLESGRAQEFGDWAIVS